ncbi:nucleotidyltransferase family protein [Pelagibacterium lacus]|uniref:Nucleotidyltransferase family protein n=1 Tax=Pelagibacterium lacus TaxID=2282655 RepID=A0A369WBQ7_9HYPH|nr:nucleotidyltransferase family protein [Pelagibacterium lacus]RDE09541.1 hypothetical protein DVH29_05105 [Pelagibacterium lacus]
MAAIDLRAFARLCLEAARGRDVRDLLAPHLAAGVPIGGIVELARSHRVVPLLAAPLCALGVTDPRNVRPPAYYASYHLHLRQQLLQLEQALRADGCRIVLLKGSIQLFRPLYPRSGMRQMADLDVLLDDAAPLRILAELGYRPTDEGQAMPTSLDVAPGQHDLGPFWRERDAARIEPHVLPASSQHAYLVGNIAEHATPAPGAEALYLPDPADQLILAMVHALCSDRASMHGGLFLRGIVECEMLYDALTDTQRQQAQDRLSARGGAHLWHQWRALADWCLHEDDAARRRSFGAARLIAELELRHRGHAGVLLASSANLAASFLRRDFWRSGRATAYRHRLTDRRFWARFAAKISAALRP